MKIAEVLKRVKCFLFNEPYLSEEALAQLKGPLLLHISDTPLDTLAYVKNVIKKINPQYIVHTGDMIDNIKLEIQPNHIREYEKGLKIMVKILENTSHAQLFYTVGNHDDQGLLEKTIHRGTVFREGTIQLKNRSFYINHFFIEESPTTDFYLYGHSLEPWHHCRDKQVGLNGLLHINVVNLDTGEIVHLDYPLGTNRLRRMERGKIGL